MNALDLKGRVDAKAWWKLFMNLRHQFRSYAGAHFKNGCENLRRNLRKIEI